MAFTLKEAREWNSSLKTSRPEMVAVVVGATSGIGEHTARNLASAIERPTIYLVGRNQTAGAGIVEALKAANPNGTYEFLPADVSKLHNVDAACYRILIREKTLDLLFMSPGTVAFGKIESESGIDRNHLVRYYGRMRFLQNLLPLLKEAQAPRVVSVLAAGRESIIEDDNLDLCKPTSFLAASTYAATMNSAAFEYLAEQNPSVSFIHEFPGIVATPLFKKVFGGFLGTVVTFLVTPISISAAESGEWNVFLSTSPSFPSKNSATSEEASGRIAPASTGQVGGGSYILKYNGQDATNKKVMTELREKQFPETLWKHTLSTFDRILSSEQDGS